jgi:hypothetical protein
MGVQRKKKVPDEERVFLLLHEHGSDSVQYRAHERIKLQPLGRDPERRIPFSGRERADSVGPAVSPTALIASESLRGEVNPLFFDLHACIHTYIHSYIHIECVSMAVTP